MATKTEDKGTPEGNGLETRLRPRRTHLRGEDRRKELEAGRFHGKLASGTGEENRGRGKLLGTQNWEERRWLWQRKGCTEAQKEGLRLFIALR